MSSEPLIRDNLHLSRPTSNLSAAPIDFAINCKHPLPDLIISDATDSLADNSRRPIGPTSFSLYRGAGRPRQQMAWSRHTSLSTRKAICSRTMHRKRSCNCVGSPAVLRRLPNKIWSILCTPLWYPFRACRNATPARLTDLPLGKLSHVVD